MALSSVKLPNQPMQRTTLRPAADRPRRWSEDSSVIEIHESDLIGFFGVSPQPEPQDEREFFGTPLFIKRVDGLELRVSISAHFCDLRLDLRKVGQEDMVFELVVPGVRSVAIERFGGRQVLRVMSESHGLVELAVEPTIEVRCDGSISA